MNIQANNIVRNLTPEQELLVAIIRSGIQEEDTSYFQSKVLDEHCLYLGINADLVREKFLKYGKRLRIRT